MSQSVDILISESDILRLDADVIVFKHAQGFFGADRAAASKLGSAGVPAAALSPAPGKYILQETRGALDAPQVLYLGTQDIYSLAYADFREFGIQALRLLAELVPDARRVAFTVHGVGFGLDEIESFGEQVTGFVQAVRSNGIPLDLGEIVIAEHNPARVQRLRSALPALIQSFQGAVLLPSGDGLRLPRPEVIRRGHAGEYRPPESLAIPQAKPHVFVAMPFKKEMDDVFYYGIQAPVRAAGYVCERVDQEAFTGDIMEQVKKKIETAAVVVADLSEANANVYLEIGYAWGKSRPTILVVKNPQDLKFDVRGQRCLAYERIRDLEQSLLNEIRTLQQQGVLTKPS